MKAECRLQKQSEVRCGHISINSLDSKHNAARHGEMVAARLLLRAARSWPPSPCEDRLLVRRRLSILDVPDRTEDKPWHPRIKECGEPSAHKKKASDRFRVVISEVEQSR